MNLKFADNRNVNILVWTVCISYLLHLLLLVFAPTTHQWNMFFLECKDFLADFFNIVRWTATKDIYVDSSVPKGFATYLPFSYIILSPFVWLLDFDSMSLQDCWANPLAMMCAAFYTIVSLVLFVHSLHCIVKKYGAPRIVILPLLLSSILIFSLERGNPIIISTACMYYFMTYYDRRENKYKYFASTCLVIATVLKVYPVFLGLLLLQKKDYKMIFYCFVLGGILTFVPFLAFESGFKAIPAFVENLGINSNIYGKLITPKFNLQYLAYWFGKMLKHFGLAGENIPDLLYSISLIAIRIFCVYAIFLSFKIEDEFYKLLLIIMVCLYFPDHSEYYCGLYLLPAFIMFFANFEKYSRQENIIFLAFAIIFMQDIQIVHSMQVNLTKIFVTVVTLFLYLYIVILQTIKLVKAKRLFQ